MGRHSQIVGASITSARLVEQQQILMAHKITAILDSYGDGKPPEYLYKRFSIPVVTSKYKRRSHPQSCNRFDNRTRAAGLIFKSFGPRRVSEYTLVDAISRSRKYRCMNDKTLISKLAEADALIAKMSRHIEEIDKRNETLQKENERLRRRLDRRATSADETTQVSEMDTP